MEDVMLKDILCHKWASDGGALVDMCEKDEKLTLTVAARWEIAMVWACCKVIYTCCL
jgi:hypothetical protein